VKISGRMVGIGVTATLVASTPFVIAYAAGAATESLLSQGRTATSSSVETSSLGPANAVDGKTSTRWASKEGSDPQWIRVDLGASHPISHVKLVWEAAYGKVYQVQTSADGTNWKSIYSTGTGNGATDDLTGLSGSGRFVRVLGTKRGTPYGYSLYEFQVFGSEGGTPSPSDPGTPDPTLSPTEEPPTTAPPTTTPPTTTPPTTNPPTTPPAGGHVDLTDPRKKEIAMELVSSAENSSLDWKAQYKYIEDIGDGRGYTAGIIGFCTGTHDLLELVQLYTQRSPNNVLAKYLPALKKVDGSDSHNGLDPTFVGDWKTAAKDPVFQKAQDDERDRVYFNPSVQQAKKDGLRALGQFAYYDAAVMHGPDGMMSIRSRALKKAKPPSQGGDETAYLNAFLDERVVEMKKEEAHSDTSRVDTEQRVFLRAGNLDLDPPLSWKVYGDPYTIK
jgi:chitosanase